MKIESDGDVFAPFKQEDVDAINAFQNTGQYHPYTCCSPEEIKRCHRSNNKSEGILIATTDGLICPCLGYTQKWVPKSLIDVGYNILSKTKDEND